VAGAAAARRRVDRFTAFARAGVEKAPALRAFGARYTPRVSGKAWALANDAAAKAAVVLRPLTRLEDADAILDVMIDTWGEHQLIPREMLRALPESGNAPIGAFGGGAMAGYVLGWAGVDRDGLHVHSHMLAVRPGLRHGGVGYALKLAQRAQALEQGITVVRWTFDPMVARNAYFNIVKLGAVCDRFERDFYGEMTDLLNAGERTDRFIVRWDLEREPGPRSLWPTSFVEVPADHETLRRSAPREAAEWRDRVADAIEIELAAGRVAAVFDRGASSYGFVDVSRVGS
jgi:predicted GNAT superfamily acetyltransferase